LGARCRTTDCLEASHEVTRSAAPATVERVAVVTREGAQPAALMYSIAGGTVLKIT